jgi:hypothetical protein
VWRPSRPNTVGDALTNNLAIATRPYIGDSDTAESDQELILVEPKGSEGGREHEAFAENLCVLRLKILGTKGLSHDPPTHT